jgi:hypothetical protein
VVTTAIFTGWNNRWDNNTYHLTMQLRLQWMDGDRAINDWRGYGNDTHGIFLGPYRLYESYCLDPLANGATVTGTVTVTANAADIAGIVKVELYVDGSLNATNQGGSGTFSWNSSSASAGTHTLSVKAYGAEGNTASAQVSVTVAGNTDTTPPTASITFPLDSSTVSGVVTVIAVANDNIGVTRVQFYVDGSLELTRLQALEFHLNTATAAAGPHTLVVVAYDGAGNSVAAILVLFALPGRYPPRWPLVFHSTTAPYPVATVTATASDNIAVKESNSTWMERFRSHRVGAPHVYLGHYQSRCRIA